MALEDGAVRRAQVLGVVMSSESMLSTLVALLRDPDAAVRASCAALFHTLGSYIDANETQLLKTRDSEGYLLVDTLRALCNDGDNAVRRSAENALLAFFGKSAASREVLQASEPAAAGLAARRARDAYVARLRDFHRDSECTGGAAPPPPPRAERAPRAAVAHQLRKGICDVQVLHVPEYVMNAHLEAAHHAAARQGPLAPGGVPERRTERVAAPAAEAAVADDRRGPNRYGRRRPNPEVPRVPTWMAPDWHGDVGLILPGGVARGAGAPNAVFASADEEAEEAEWRRREPGDRTPGPPTPDDALARLMRGAG